MREMAGKLSPLVIIGTVVKNSCRSSSIFMEGAGLRLEISKHHYIPLMEIRAQQLNATKRDDFLGDRRKEF